MNDPKILIWNTKAGIRNTGSHNFHPGINLLSPNQWAGLQREAEHRVKVGDLEVLGESIAAIEPAFSLRPSGNRR